MVKRLDLVSVIVPLAAITFVLLDFRYGGLSMADIQSAVPYIAFTIIIGVFLWGQQRRLENALGRKTTTSAEEATPQYIADLNFGHLAIHYLRIKGTPDTPDSSQLRYITNDEKRQASRLRELPDYLAPAIKNHRMIWNPYDDEKVLYRKVLAWMIPFFVFFMFFELLKKSNFSDVFLGSTAKSLLKYGKPVVVITENP